MNPRTAVVHRIIPALLVAAAAAGCTTVDPPGGRGNATDSSRDERGAAPGTITLDLFPDESPPLEWPERWGEELAGTPGVIVPIEGALEGLASARVGRHGRLRPDPDDLAQLSALAATHAAGPYLYRFEGPRSFVFLRPERRLPERFEPGDRAAPGPRDPDDLFVFVSGRTVDDQTERGVPSPPRVEIQRTWFAQYRPDEGAEARGTILFLPGLFGVPGFVNDAIVRTMRREGWTVVRMLAPPSRFTEREVITVAHPTGISEAAELAADRLDHRLAETAYAAEAALRRARTTDPDLSGKPVVLYASSGSALAAPAVAARLDGNLDASVIVAGGAGLISIVSGSSYAGWVDGLQFEWKGFGGRPDEIYAFLLEQRYLRLSALDPYNRADALDDVPTLLIHAAGDRAVPAERGELLWQRLGRPERWTDPVGHGLLFLTLHFKTGRILRWIDEALRTDGAPRDADDAGGSDGGDRDE